MSTLSVFELAQQEADEQIWVPARATRWISRLLTREFSKRDTISSMERHRHKRQPKPAGLTVTQLRRASRKHSISNEGMLSPMSEPDKKISSRRRCTHTGLDIK